MTGKLIRFLLIVFIWRFNGTQCQLFYCIHENPRTEQFVFGKSPVEPVTSCNAIGMENEKALCQKPVDFSTSNTYDVTPVTDTSTDTAYINIHCALCNGAKRKRLRYWPLRIKCHGAETVDLKNVNDIVKAVSDTEGCEITFGISPSDEDSEQIQYECNHFTRTCDTGTTDINSCFSQSLSIVIWRGLFFLNTYCAECNGIPSDNVRPFRDIPMWAFTAWLLLPRKPTNHTDEVCQTMGSLSGSLHAEPSMQEDCLKTRCSPIRTLSNRTCMKMDLIIDTGTYAVCMRLKPLTTITLQTALGHAEELYRNIRTILVELFGLTYFYDSTTEVLFTSENDFNQDILLARFKFFDWQIKLRNPARLDPESMLQKLLRLARDTHISSWVNNDTEILFPVLLKECADLKVSAIVVSECLASMNDTGFCKPMVDTIMTTAEVTAKHIIFGVGIEDSSSFYDSSLETYLTNESNILEFRKCPFVEVSIKDTDREETENGLMFSKQGLFLPFSKFLYGHTRDSIWICRNWYYNILENLRRNVVSAGYSAKLTSFLLLLLHIAVYFIYSHAHN